MLSHKLRGYLSAHLCNYRKKMIIISHTPQQFDEILHQSILPMVSELTDAGYTDIYSGIPQDDRLMSRSAIVLTSNPQDMILHTMIDCTLFNCINH